MRSSVFSSNVTGVVVPISALRSKESCGTGEFADLVHFADLCESAGLNLIQVLPVNDTGTESSPYSALSAFALHPIYMRLQDLPEAKKFSSDIAALRAKHESAARFNYREVRADKLTLLRKIFDKSEREIKKSAASGELAKWIAENPWVIGYAVFMNLKYYNFEASWKAWDKMRTPTHAEIQARWDNPAHAPGHLFYAWLQMRLDQQFQKAADYCRKKNIALKGDIPIMMNEDSCDIWANPEFFRSDLRAGSPPDGSNPTGQNWGFPIYNWDNLERSGFEWWKNRLKSAAKYYDAYRIDHILGFFRIWSVPDGEMTGALGWPVPCEGISTVELSLNGFTGDRLRWITQPHVQTRDIEAVNNRDYLGTHGQLHKVMDRIGDEELWLFKPFIACDGDIARADLLEPVKNELCKRWRDRILVVCGRDSDGQPEYAPARSYRDATAWGTLSTEEKAALEKLFEEKQEKELEHWRAQAEKLLSVIVSATDMVPCAEDLGDVPACLPEVLDELSIYSLKVIRWEREWGVRNEPFKDIHAYPAKSVATTSVHDSSIFRAWWEKEEGGNAFCKTFFAKEAAAADKAEKGQEAAALDMEHYTAETAAKVLSLLAETSSQLFILPIQDWLDLDSDFCSIDSDKERINVPGTVSEFNWTYRLPVSSDELRKNKKLVAAIRAIAEKRINASVEQGAK